MAHIHTVPNGHDLVVSMYIIRLDQDEPKIMLHLHRKLNKWLQFGGHVEIDENPWQAVAHELREESGYELSQLKLLQPKTRMKHIEGAILHPQPINLNTHKIDDNHNHIGIDYAFVTSEEPLKKIEEGESELVKLVSKSELLAMTDTEIFRGTKEICAYVFEVCLPEWEQVPAT